MTIPLLNVEYAQTGASTAQNLMGMREMQARAFAKRQAQYLLLKAPPASGKSRALMFLALDKLRHQGLKAAVSDFLARERAGVLAYAEEARTALPYRQA